MKKTILTLMIALGIFTLNAQTTMNMEADINKKPRNSKMDHKPIVYKGKLYFGAVAQEGHQAILHVYDGSTTSLAAGVSTTSGEGSDPREMIVFQDKIFYAGHKSWLGTELFSYDGTNAPVLVADIYDLGQASSMPHNFAVYNNKLYFNATTANGTQLWVYDGTNAPAPLQIGSGITDAKELTVYKNKLYFSAYLSGDLELFEYDGVNPIKMHNINTNTTGFIGSYPTGFAIFRDTLFFGARGTDGANDLYKFFPGDDFKLAHIYAGPRRHTNPSELTVFKGKIYYSGNPRFGSPDLIEYDGISEPKVVFVINGTNGSYPHSLTVVGDNLYFVAGNSVTGVELYKYDGINDPTLVEDLMPGILSSMPTALVDFNGELVFSGTDTITGKELRIVKKGQGSTGKSSLIKDFSPGNEGSNPNKLIGFKDKLYFYAKTAEHGNELWSFDGTDAALVEDHNLGAGDGIINGSAAPVLYKDKLVYPIKLKTNTITLATYDGVNAPIVLNNSLSFASNISNMIVFKDNVYFSGFNFTVRTELFKYDGDTITLVKDINPTGDGIPSQFYVWKDHLYFTANDGVNGSELWVYDGINDPTMVADINTSGNSYPSSFQELNGKLYFIATKDKDARLFEYDGTNPPVELVHGNLRSLQHLAKYDNELYFSAWDGSYMPEAYKYDGINPPTLIADIYPGTYPGNPTGFTSYNGKLYFGANNGVTGIELWTYDGKDTASFDIVPGETSSDPKEFYPYHGKLYFSVSTLEAGYELWSIEAPVTTKGITKNIITTINAFPNPTSGVVTITGFNEPIEKISIYSISGQLVSVINNTNTLDIASYETGVYILLIESKDKMGYTKLIKK